jgi:hypothetical protein
MGIINVSPHKTYPDGLNDVVTREGVLRNQYKLSQVDAAAIVNAVDAGADPTLALIRVDPSMAATPFSVSVVGGKVYVFDPSSAAGITAVATSVYNAAGFVGPAVTPVTSSSINPMQADINKYGFSNPTFDSRIRGEPPDIVLNRGYIIQDPTAYNGAAGGASSGQTQPFCCNFLYNPNNIEVDYAVNPGALPWTQQATPGAIFSSNMQTMSFDILFDRSYEISCLGNNPNVPADPHNIYQEGVRADVGALERCCGIYNGGTLFGGQGPLIMTPLQVIFGSNPCTTNVNRISSGATLAFFGYVSNLSVTYTHFAYDMIPIRADVNLSFSQIQQSADSSTTSTAGLVTTGLIDTTTNGTTG